ncbi:Peroxin-3 [Phycomyces blakesleeanus]
MQFFTSIKDYAKRHRKGLLITASLAGGGYLAGRFAASKIRDMQEKTTSDRMARENLKRRFQQNQNDCVFTVMSLLPTLGDQILNEMNIEAQWAKLQESRKLERSEDKARLNRDAAKNTQTEQEGGIKPEEHPTESQDLSASSVKIDLIKVENAQDTTGSQATLENSVDSLSEAVDPAAPAVPRVVPEGVLDRKAKQLVWEEIKRSSFTRTLTSIYSITLLTMLTHVQLNLLGRFTYVWSVSALSRSEPSIKIQQEEGGDAGFLDPQTERMFLSASWWLLHRGWRKCSKRIQEAVDDIVGSIPLRSTISYEKAEDILYKLRRRIEFEDDGKTPFSFRSWMLPDTPEEEAEFLRETGFSEVSDEFSTNKSSVTFRRLIDETKDFIDSPDFSSVLTSCLDEIFGIFDAQAFGKSLLPQDDFETGERIREVTEADLVNMKPKTSTLAKLLPVISRQAHLVIAGNEYLNAFAYIKELQAFSAMVYTQYEDEVV